MYTASLRKVGGSVMLAIPPAFLDLLHLKAGASIDVELEGDRLILQPRSQPRYSLDELLARCDGTASLTVEDREWIDAPPAGKEIL
ncbi:MAG: AbrB/MazE/SpoVT family DNA-binding domain-containing protein [Rectinemataceae bacterium]